MTKSKTRNMTNRKAATRTPDHIGDMAARLGITREEVERACDNLLDGDGKIYRKVIHNQLHGKRNAVAADRVAG